MKRTKEQRRLLREQFVRLYTSGVSHPNDIAQKLHISLSTAYNWINKYNNEGVVAFFTTRTQNQGHSPKVDHTNLQRFFREIREAKAKAYGFPDDMWTTKRVTLLLKKSFSAEYNPRYVARLLKKYNVPFQTTYQTRTEIKKIVTLMLKKTPTEMQIADVEDWTLTHIQQLLLKKLGYEYSLGYIYQILHSYGHTPRKINLLRRKTAA